MSQTGNSLGRLSSEAEAPAALPARVVPRAMRRAETATTMLIAFAESTAPLEPSSSIIASPATMAPAAPPSVLKP